MMKSSYVGLGAMLLAHMILLLLFTMGEGHKSSTPRSSKVGGLTGEDKHQIIENKEIRGKGKGVEKEVFGTGSSLPDCSHACGPCFPCRRVMVSYKCTVAESCPMVYRCMCGGRYYHVPSN